MQMEQEEEEPPRGFVPQTWTTNRQVRKTQSHTSGETGEERQEVGGGSSKPGLTRSEPGFATYLSPVQSWVRFLLSTCEPQFPPTAK